LAAAGLLSKRQKEEKKAEKQEAREMQIEGDILVVQALSSSAGAGILDLSATW
jgi:hypothetical protein